MVKKRCYLKAEVIHKFLSGDDELDTLILCKPDDINLVTTDQSLYEALGSIEDKSEINYNKLVKFLENVDIMSFKYSMKKDRKVLRQERVDEIRDQSKKKFEIKTKNNEAIKDARKEN